MINNLLIIIKLRINYLILRKLIKFYQIKMPKITLNFFGETINSDIPKTLSSLRSEISKLFYFSPQDAAEILLTYKLNGEKK